MVNLVIYKLSDENMDYTPFFNAIKGYDSIQLFDNVWLIDTNENTSEIATRLRKLQAVSGDRILVSVISKKLGANGWISSAAIEWLANHMKD